MCGYLESTVCRLGGFIFCKSVPSIFPQKFDDKISRQSIEIAKEVSNEGLF